VARVTLLGEEDGDAIQGTLGPEARRALAHRPAVGDAIGLYNAAVAASDLDARLHELVRFRIANINNCFR
jgi:alkylhydroperoxidase family enzyme